MIIRKLKKLFEDWNEALRESAPYMNRWGGWYGFYPINCY